mgnify:CR=1 FL=1
MAESWTRERIEEEIRSIISEVSEIPCEWEPKKENYYPQQETFFGELGINSLDLAELLVEVEDTFDIEIPPEEAEELTTVESLVRYVEEKLEAK